MDRRYVGIFLVVLGGLFLLERMGTLRAWPLVVPAFFIVLGLGQISDRHNRRGGYIMFALGALLLLLNLNIIPWRALQLWPLVLVAIGVWILLGRGTRRTDVSDDTVDIFAAFGSNTSLVRSPRFAGGDVTAIFGGSELDLRHAGLDPQGAVLNVTVMFGGLQIMTPPEWVVDVKTVAIFGGVENKDGPVRAASSGQENRPVLTLRGPVLFGGIEIT